MHVLERKPEETERYKALLERETQHWLVWAGLNRQTVWRRGCAAGCLAMMSKTTRRSGRSEKGKEKFVMSDTVESTLAAGSRLFKKKVL